MIILKAIAQTVGFILGAILLAVLLFAGFGVVLGALEYLNRLTFNINLVGTLSVAGVATQVALIFKWKLDALRSKAKA